MQKLSFMLFFLNRLVSCCVWTGLLLSWTVFLTVTRDLSFSWRGLLLCIKLLGWGLLIGCAGGFPLSQVIAALILLPHAVDQQEDEEDGEQEADHTTCNNSWEKWRGKVTINAQKVRSMSTVCPHGEWFLRWIVFCAINYNTVNFSNCIRYCCNTFQYQCDSPANYHNWGFKCGETTITAESQNQCTCLMSVGKPSICLMRYKVNHFLWFISPPLTCVPLASLKVGVLFKGY